MPAIVADRPNLIVLISDDHGQLDCKPYGSTEVRTPNMRRLADAGMTFTQAFVASPSCAPSRAAMLTGLMPARNGAERNHTSKRDGIRSLPDVLRELGYQTAAFGKVAHFDIARHGFDVHDKTHSGPFVADFLARRDAAKPLCMFVGTEHPHTPWPDIDGYDPQQVTPPATHVDTAETRDFRARYLTEVTQADTWLGEMLEAVAKHLDPRSTIVVYTSDHGSQWPFGKWNLYDAGIRVPFLVSWPGVVAPGSRSDAMVQSIDILPTLVAAAGGAPPEGIDGRSFLPVLEGRTAVHRDVVFTTHSGDGDMNVYPIRAIRTPQWKLIQNLHPEFAHTTYIDKATVKDGFAYWTSWYEKAKTDPVAAAKVKRYHERPAVELYDLATDPHEIQNLAALPEQTERVRDLRSRLEAWMDEQGDRRTVFGKPRLLSDPASTVLGTRGD